MMLATAARRRDGQHGRPIVRLVCARLSSDDSGTGLAGARLCEPQSLRLVDVISYKGFGGHAARQSSEDLTNGLAVGFENLTMSPVIVLAGQQPIRIDAIRRNDRDQNVEGRIRRGLIRRHAQRDFVHSETLCYLFELLAGDQAADP
jgi:hypothetical protein